MRSPISYHYHLDELPNVLRRADTQTPARPSPFSDLRLSYSNCAKSAVDVQSVFDEKDEIRKQERETERKGRRELAGANGYKVCTWSSLEESKTVLNYTWF